MCGICGYADSAHQHNEIQLCQTVTRMADSIKHRGPDDSGAWADPDNGVALGFRRLAIIDLSPAGHQPMHSSDGRFSIVYNGEVYNYESLRKELEPFSPTYLGHSDTEVILTAVRHWGVEAAVKKFVGMFAMALWDRQERQLYLIRDRLGIKPLYYGWMGKTFLFGSELKALKEHQDFHADIDRGSLALMIKYAYIPEPHSIYRGIYKLPPGTILRVDVSRPEAPLTPEPYWSAKEVAEEGLRNPFTGSDEDAIRELEDLLKESISLRMIADVPLGAFLSGGIDSSTVVALMQAQSGRPVKTFSIGFNESEYNEAVQARAVAQHLGTDHTELYVSPEEAMAVIPKLPFLYDEPYADASQIPTYLVSELARRHVTVSLSGDGGDELFAGYDRYAVGRTFWNSIGWIPSPVRQGAANMIRSLSMSGWDSILQPVGGLLPERMRKHPGSRVYRVAAGLARHGPEDLYLDIISTWNNPTDLVREASVPDTLFTRRDAWANVPDFTRRMMFLDLVTYLPDDILAKVDRASMGVSLEARVPLLDHRVVAFAWRLPMSMKLRAGKTKWALRQILYKYVPPALVERPKQGFGVPIDHWLRGRLREWAEELLDENRLRREGFLNPAPIRQAWQEHLSGQASRQYPLWTVLMFQSWLEFNKN